tara:strand:- start:91 stop:792 length:702 start_codon:yes stop_codon:yes gene_type:complete
MKNSKILLYGGKSSALKILLYGGKSTSLVVSEMLKDIGISPKYIFDQYTKKLHFKSNAKFSNNKKDLKKFIEKSNFYFVCVGDIDGKLRHKISKVLRDKGLNQFSLISKNSIIDKTSKFGKGTFIMQNVVVQKLCKIGDDCYLQTNCVIDHECIIGNGVHFMGSCYLAGRVQVGDYVSVGANATILPDIKIGKNAIIGAGSVVTKNVKPNEVVIGNPAKFLRLNNKKYDFNIL